MERITLGQLLQAVGGQLLGTYADLNTSIFGVDTDSRNLHKEHIFLPIVGERFDGHNYIEAALEAGAIGCLTQNECAHYRGDKFYVRVADTQRALRDLAVWYKHQFSIPFLAVTGSVGKTTAKDMLASVLGARFRVLKTEGNFNNNLGLPLTLLRLDHSHEICVLEMGMDCFGEIDYLGEAVKPNVGIITNIGDAHIERLGSRENIFRAKCELLPHIQKDGLLILNGDDQWLKTLRDTAPVSTVYCGRSEGLDYRVQARSGDGITGIRCRVDTPKFHGETDIPALGAHMIYPVSFAVAAGEYFGLTESEILQGLRQFKPTRMRMNVYQRKEQITILDDTYNANPQSMRAAIRVLADTHSAHKVAILGDMLELGPFSSALHTSVGEWIGKTDIGCVLAVGAEAEQIAQGAKASGVPEVLHCLDKEQAKQMLKPWIQPDTAFLLKASRGMKLEELTAFLMEHTQEGYDKL